MLIINTNFKTLFILIFKLHKTYYLGRKAVLNNNPKKSPILPTLHRSSKIDDKPQAVQL
jgi:hypothetical protein